MSVDIVRMLVKTLEEAGGKKTSPYDTKGIVKRIEGKTAWIKVSDEVDETPVERTIDCQPGDTVQVRIAGGNAWLTGNLTDPPTGDKVARKASETAGKALKAGNSALEGVNLINDAIDGGRLTVKEVRIEHILSTSNAQLLPYGGMDWGEELPEFVTGCFYWTRTATYYYDGTVKYGTPFFDMSAQTTAEVEIAQNSTNNHFWSDNTGAYVTEQDQSWQTGYATRITNAGILQSYNGLLMTSWTNSGAVFYASDGQTKMAEYGTAGTILYAGGTPAAYFRNSGINFNDAIPFTVGNANSFIKWVLENGTWKIKIAADSVEIGGAEALTTQDQLTVDDIAYAYQLSTSGTSIPSGTWSSTPLAPTATQYLWTRTTVTYSDGSVATSYSVGGKAGADGQPGTDGDDGTSVSITSTSVMYQSHYSGTQTPTGTWQNSVPSVSQGYYLWTRTIVNYSDGTSTTSYSVARQGSDGSDITSQYMFFNSSGTYAGLNIKYTNYNNRILLDANGLKIYDGTGANVANFGNEISLGENDTVGSIYLCGKRGLIAGEVDSYAYRLMLGSNPGSWQSNYDSTATIISADSYPQSGYAANARMRLESTQLGTSNFQLLLYGKKGTNIKNVEVSLANNVSDSFLTVDVDNTRLYGDVDMVNGVFGIRDRFSIDRNGNVSSYCDDHTVGPGYSIKTTDNGREIALMLGAGGSNRGLYDHQYSKWIAYVNNTDYSTGKVLTQWTGFSTTSDRKKKDIIGDISYAREFISALHPVQYHWKEGDPSKVSMGFIAQDVDAIGKKLGVSFNLVTAAYAAESEKVYHGEDVDDSELNWFLSYEEIIAPLVQVVQNQQKDIDELKRQLRRS